MIRTTTLLFFSSLFFINSIFSMNYEHTRRIAPDVLTNATSMAISPKGDLVGIGGKASDKALVKWWDVKSGKLVGYVNTSRLGYLNYANSVAFNPDSTIIAASGCESTGLWDTQTGQWLQRIAMDSDSHSIAFSPENKLLIGMGMQLATYAQEESGEFAEKDSKKQFSYIRGHVRVGKKYIMIPLIREGLQVNERRVPGKTQGSIIRKMPEVKLHDMGPNEEYMVSLTGESRISIHEIEKGGACVQQLRCPYPDEVFFAGENEKEVSSLALSRDETKVAAVRASTIYLWRDWMSRDSLQELSVEGSGVREVAFGSDGLLVALTKDGTVDMWREKK